MNLLPEPPKASNQDPLYNIGVVTRMTGISMATLRAWERRYNFPEAERSVGGHRLYSESDILRLRWVKDRIDDGMQTGQAIQALRHQEAHSPRLDEPLARTDRSLESHAAALNPVAIYHKDLLNALLNNNLERADRVLGEALAIYSPDELIMQVFSPVMDSLGEAWEKDQISIASEHLGTNYLRQRLLMWMVSGPPSLRMPPVLLSCAPDEWHEGSLLILGALLRRQGYPVAYLGQAVPLPDLSMFIREIRPSLVVLVAMTEATAGGLAGWPTHLPEIAASGKPPVCYGGRVYVHHPELKEKMTGIYLGDTFELGLRNLDAQLKGSR